MDDQLSNPRSDIKVTSQILSPGVSADLYGGSINDWLVCGWFTPDYRPLAEKLAANLAAHGAPFHLWARPKLGQGWNTLQKPTVVLEAMDAYPGKTLLLMDVDCIVRGGIAQAAAIAGDVGLALKARQTRKGKAWQKRISVVLSSRVVVFRPTEGARTFAREWQARCKEAHYSGDETAMTWAFLRRPEVAYDYLDDRFRAWELGGQSMPADALIVHESAHDRMGGSRVAQLAGTPFVALRHWAKAFERRWLRSGRTKRRAMARLG